MNCRHCGVEIADKALICYRCGTATTEAAFKPASRAPSRLPGTAGLVAVALLAVVALVLGRTATGDSSRYLSWAVVALAVAIVVLRAYVRRR